MWRLILLSTIILGLAVAALAVKMFFVKGGQFTKTCASIDEKGKQVPCTCKNTPGEKCVNYDKHHGRDNVPDSPPEAPDEING
ncbi:MAG: hypothetical protein BWY70_00101 [Bacteroidetes bacterium ADurb.Bin408]|nr:MAG: hypothetical protein BWY70_00101 [Bacteroidetes bacterium ADurb.Bin408]